MIHPWFMVAKSRCLCKPSLAGAHRLMFATDYLRVGQETPIIDSIRTADLTKDAFDRITRKNAEKVFGI